MFFCSVRTRGNFSPARNVLSTTEPLVEPLQLRAHERAALARLDVLELDDAPGLALELDVHAVAELVGGDDLGHGRASVATAERPVSQGQSPGHGLRRSADLGQLLRERGEEVDAVVADDRQVLDPHAAEALEVDARLDRDGVPGAQRVARLGREARRLVHGQPDAVTEAVAEVLAEAGVGDRLARELVGLDARSSPP